MGIANHLQDSYQAHASLHSLVNDPGAGGTFNFYGKDNGYAQIASGTRKLPDNIPEGVRFTVYATGSVTLTNVAGTTVATLATGQYAECRPLTSTTWAASVGIVGASGIIAALLDDIHTTLTTTQGFIDLPLAGWREIFTNDIGVAAVAAAQGSGGILATDTTPTLEYVNADTDSQIRMLWAASNSDPIARQITLPPDLDRTANIVLNVRTKMSGTTDVPAIDIDTFFDEGDTKVEDASGDLNDTVTNKTITIAAADVPDTATTMSIELTPGAHTTDTVAVYATWLTYTKKLLTS